jgi:hypothetical protein
MVLDIAEKGSEATDIYNQSADHHAALVSFQTLQQNHPNTSPVFHDMVIRDWSQVCAVESHIYGQSSIVMDINIAAELWFAASCGSTIHSTQPIIIDQRAIW